MKAVRIVVLVIAAFVLIAGIVNLFEGSATTGAVEVVVAVIALISASDALARARATKRGQTPQLRLWQVAMGVGLFGVMGTLGVAAALTSTGLSALFWGVSAAFLYSLAAVGIVGWHRSRSSRYP